MTGGAWNKVGYEWYEYVTQPTASKPRKEHIHYTGCESDSYVSMRTITLLLEYCYLVQCTDILIISWTADWIFMAGCRKVIWDESVETFSVSNNHKTGATAPDTLCHQQAKLHKSYLLPSVHGQSDNISDEKGRIYRLQETDYTSAKWKMTDGKIRKWSSTWLNPFELAGDGSEIGEKWLQLKTGWLRRLVFPGNHLHWYWQLKTNRTLWSFYLFLCTVFLLAIRLPCFNKLELS